MTAWIATKLGLTKKGKMMTAMNKLGASRSLQLLTTYKTKRQKNNFVKKVMFGVLLTLTGLMAVYLAF